jgi:formylglycine-generating enzyme required for sulfatase activity
MKPLLFVRNPLLWLWVLAVSGVIHAAPPVREDVKESVGKTASMGTDRLGEMVTIPAGSFLMGNDGHEGLGGPEEFPQHLVSLPAYQIGKYEVTRGQYRKFIEAGGYEDPRYWSPDGWKWKESDVIDYAGMYGKGT